MTNLEQRIESTRLVGQAMSLQLSDDNGTLAEIESLLQQALQLWGDNLDALEEAAHFYDAVMDDAANALKYAKLCRARAVALVASMDEILADRERLPASATE